ncbi:MAG: hypothetical protein AAFY98_12260, partial [Verrucomicrobiota bacterium]
MKRHADQVRRRVLGGGPCDSEDEDIGPPLPSFISNGADHRGFRRVAPSEQGHVAEAAGRALNHYDPDAGVATSGAVAGVAASDAFAEVAASGAVAGVADSDAVADVATSGADAGAENSRKRGVSRPPQWRSEE